MSDEGFGRGDMEGKRQRAKGKKEQEKSSKTMHGRIFTLSFQGENACGENIRYFSCLFEKIIGCLFLSFVRVPKKADPEFTFICRFQTVIVHICKILL